MTNTRHTTTREAADAPPASGRDATGAPEQNAVLDTIEWFITRDPRVGVIRHPHVEELFRWKQSQTTDEAATFTFDSAEDRLAIGIHQALVVHATEQELHAWIAGLLSALEESRGIVEGMTEQRGLDAAPETSALTRAAALPEAERDLFLTACWLEVLCTAEARVLGWVYQSLYGKAFQPDNLPHH